MNTPATSHRWSRHGAVLYCALVLAGNAFAASEPPSPSSKESGVSQPRTVGQPDQRGKPITNADLPPARKIQHIQNATGNSAKEKERHVASAEWWASPDWWIAGLTAVLAFVTWRLVVQTRHLVTEASATSNRQASETIRALDIAGQAANAAKDSADALVRTSMPVLFPSVINMAGLHPLIPIKTSYTHTSNIFIKFENFGGTPGTIREVRARLYLTLNDVLPEARPAEWNALSYPVMIPGNSRAADQHFGALDMRQEIAYGNSEIAELHAEADPNGVFRRFVLMGMVTYDDFFGWRHVRTYCVKMRTWITEEGSPLNQFQVGIGGAAYNKWTKEKIPSPDPFEKA